MDEYQQVILDMGEGVRLSIVQGLGVMGSRSRGTVEVAILREGEGGRVIVDEPEGYLRGPDLAGFIQTYLQDRDEGALHQ